MFRCIIKFIYEIINYQLNKYSLNFIKNSLGLNKIIQEYFNINKFINSVIDSNKLFFQNN